MTAAICIVGPKNAGKTTIIEGLLREMVSRGRRVATIKHDAHDFEIDIPGKDTWRHREAGSSTTIIASSSKVAMVRLTDRMAELDELLALVDPSYDLVLIEGFRRSSFPKVLISSSGPEVRSRAVLGPVWAVVSQKDAECYADASHFRPDDVKGLADLLNQRLLGKVPAHNSALP